MTNYDKGARKERELIRLARDAGWGAMRSAGSHGAFDVILWNARYHIHGQVKKASDWSHNDLAKMLAEPCPQNTELMLFEYDGRDWARWMWDGLVWKRYEGLEL